MGTKNTTKTKTRHSDIDPCVRLALRKNGFERIDKRTFERRYDDLYVEINIEPNLTITVVDYYSELFTESVLICDPYPDPDESDLTFDDPTDDKFIKVIFSNKYITITKDLHSEQCHKNFEHLHYFKCITLLVKDKITQRSILCNIEPVVFLLSSMIMESED